MGKIIAVVNQKGGVGKTTTAVNLSASLSAIGKKVLLCDFDPQANATSGIGVSKSSSNGTIYDALIGSKSIADITVHTKYTDLLPSGSSLSGAGIELIDFPDREARLRYLLQPFRDFYDYIFIDAPPSLELLTLNALCAANSVLIPVQCEYYALEGLSDLLGTLRAVKKRANPSIEIFGLLLTMFDGRLNLSMQVAEEVRKHFPGKVFHSVIPRNVRLSEAPSHGIPVIAYDRSSRGSDAYLRLAEEILKKGEE